MSEEKLPVLDPEKIQRLFGSPLHFPPEFKTWMIDQMILNVPDLPVGQAFQGRNLAKLVAHSTSAVTGVTAQGTSPGTMFSFTLPKGTLGQNGRLVIDHYIQVSCGDVSNAGHVYLYANGNIIGEFPYNTAFLDFNLRNATMQWIIQNRGSYTSQLVYGYYWMEETSSWRGVGSGFIATPQSFDTTANVTIEAKGVWDSGGSQQMAHRFFTANAYNPAKL